MKQTHYFITIIILSLLTLTIFLLAVKQQPGKTNAGQEMFSQQAEAAEEPETIEEQGPMAPEITVEAAEELTEDTPQAETGTGTALEKEVQKEDSETETIHQITVPEGIVPETTAAGLEGADDIVRGQASDGQDAAQEEENQRVSDIRDFIRGMSKNSAEPLQAEQPEEPESEFLKDSVAKYGTLGVDYPVLSYFGYRDSYGGQISSYHRGIDFYMDVGTELVAPEDCVVSYVGYNSSRGYWIVMYWKDGCYVEYQHLSQITVNAGTFVPKGTTVGYSGETGTSLMPHLHLGILKSYDRTDSVYNFDDQNLRIDPYYFVFGEW